MWTRGNSEGRRPAVSPPLHGKQVWVSCGSVEMEQGAGWNGVCCGEAWALLPPRSSESPRWRCWRELDHSSLLGSSVEWGPPAGLENQLLITCQEVQQSLSMAAFPSLVLSNPLLLLLGFGGARKCDGRRKARAPALTQWALDPQVGPKRRAGTKLGIRCELKCFHGATLYLLNPKTKW